MKRGVSIVLCCVISGGVAFAVHAATVRTSGQTDEHATATTSSVIVKWKPFARGKIGSASQSRLQRQALRAQALITPNVAASDFTITDEYEKRNLAVVSSQHLTTDELVTRLQKNPLVASARPNPVFTPHAQTTPWGLNSEAGIHATTAHAQGTTGKGVLVALIDTGVNYTHEDLAENIWTPTNGDCVIAGELVTGGCPHGGYDFVDEDNDPMDSDNHGTNVAGILAARNNDLGLIGVAPDATIMIVRALTYTSGSLVDIVEGIDFAIENGADVINMSLGSPYTGYVLGDLQDALDEAERKGIAVIASSGNGATNALQMPSGLEQVIAVGAVQETAEGENPYANYNTRLAYFSNFGKVNLVAPGMDIFTTTDDGSYAQDEMVGTSLAAPYVTGAVALLLQKNPSLQPAQIRHLLETTAEDLGMEGKDEFFGAGLVDVEAALGIVNAAVDTTAVKKSIVVEANWAENGTIEYVDGYYLEPTVSSTMIPADGQSTTTVRARVARTDGTPLADEIVSLTTTGGLILYSASATTDTDGTARFLIQAPLEASEEIVTATLNSTGASDSLLLRFADTLLVNDAGQPDTPGFDGWTYAQALETAGALWRMSPHPTAAWERQLSSYRTVVWMTGSYSLNTTEQEHIKQYLRNDGRLFVSGGEVLHTLNYAQSHADEEGYALLESDSVLRSWLAVSFARPVATHLTFVGNGRFAGIGDELDDYGSAEENYFYSDALAVEASGSVGGYFCSNADTALVTVRDGYRSAFLGLSLDVLPKASVDAVFAGVLAFLEEKEKTDGGFVTPTECDSSSRVDDGSAPDPNKKIDVPAPLSKEVNADLAYPFLKHPVMDVTDASVMLSWETDDLLYGSIGYARNGITGNIDAEATGDASTITLSDLSPQTPYTIVVHGIYQSGYLTPATAVTVSTQFPPTQPTIVRVQRTRVTVQLNEPAVGAKQWAEVLTEGGTLVKRASAGSSTAVTVTGLAANTEYVIRTVSVTEHADESVLMSPASDPVSFKTSSDVVGRISAEKKTRTEARIQWKRPSAGVKRYVIQLWKKSNGQFVHLRTITREKKANTESISQRIVKLKSGTRYRVRVRTRFSETETGPWSSFFSFRTSE